MPHSSPSLQSEYTVPFTVRSYEVNAHGTTHLSSVCNYFQEAAGIHADHLNFDISQLQEKGLTWVLFKMQVEVQRFPGRWEEVLVRTRPSSGDGLRAFRDYELVDTNGNRLAAAVSQWMVLNTKTRRPVRIPDEILQLGLNNRNHILEPDKKPLKGAPRSANAEFMLRAGIHDLDMNHHVNNVRYIEWVTGYLPGELTKNLICKSVDVQYMAECVAGDAVYQATEVSQNGDESLRIAHTLFKNEDQTPIAAAITNWSPNPYSSLQS
jgi:medium-chain acyl-[acyl-carrier-protein] hydrolase